MNTNTETSNYIKIMQSGIKDLCKLIRFFNSEQLTTEEYNEYSNILDNVIKGLNNAIKVIPFGWGDNFGATIQEKLVWALNNIKSLLYWIKGNHLSNKDKEKILKLYFDAVINKIHKLNRTRNYIFIFYNKKKLML